MIKSTVGEQLDRWIHIAFPFLFWWPLNPNLLTVIGALVSLAAAIAFAAGSFLPGGLLVFAGGFFDLVDGVVARHRGVSTTFGGFLDSTLDRFVDDVLFAGLLVFYAGEGEGLTALAASLALVASVLTSYAKARADQVIGNLRGGLLERGERIGLLALGAVLGFMPLALWLLALGGSITVAQRFSIAYREMEALDAASSSRDS